MNIVSRCSKKRILFLDSPLAGVALEKDQLPRYDLIPNQWLNDPNISQTIWPFFKQQEKKNSLSDNKNKVLLYWYYF